MAFIHLLARCCAISVAYKFRSGERKKRFPRVSFNYFSMRCACVFVRVWILRSIKYNISTLLQRANYWWQRLFLSKKALNNTYLMAEHVLIATASQFKSIVIALKVRGHVSLCLFNTIFAVRSRLLTMTRARKRSRRSCDGGGGVEEEMKRKIFSNQRPG